MTKQLITNNVGEKPAPIKVISCWFSVISSRSGQSLIEVMIGLAIGAIMIGASALAVSSMLGSSVTTQKWRSASGFSQGLLDNVRTYGSSNWQNLYGLTKASSTQYFLNASGTAFRVIQGKEGMLDNDVTNGLVGQWKFDEGVASNGTTYDASPNNNNATFSTDPVRASSTCKIYNCLNFNGSYGGVVSVSNNSVLDIATSSFSVSLWGYYRDYTYPKAWFMIKKSAYCYSAVYPGWDFGHGYNSTGINACFNNGVNSTGNYGLTFDAGYRPTDLVNKWAYLVMVVNRTTNRIQAYVNGVKQTNELDISGVLGSISNSSPLSIGGMYGWKTDANIDDVRIYNRALSASEVSQIYKSNIFSRYFYIENTCRTSDASSSISGTSPCSAGSLDDPSTQKINAITEWTSNNLVTTQFPLSDYVTRWQNATLQQNDWSGGASSTAIVSTPTNVFSSSSGIDYSTKAIRIQGL